MKTFTHLAGAAAGIFLFHAAHADILYVAATGRITANGVPTAGVKVEATPRNSTTRVPIRYDASGPYNYWPNPQTTSGVPDATGNNYLLAYADENGWALTPPPSGLYFRHPLQDGAYFTPVDVSLKFSLPGYQAVTISADDVYMAYLASLLPGTPDRALGIAVINANLVSQTVSVIATDASASEAGTKTASFKFVRSGNTSGSLTVPFALGGTATNGVDYKLLSTSVVFPAGVTEKTIIVDPIDDKFYEGDESVIATVTPTLLYAISGAPASATIIDNDPKPSVTVAATRPLTVELNWVPNGEFTVSRTGDTTLPLVVSVAVGGTAQSGLDYVAIGGPAATKTITIPAGKSSVVVLVDPVIDTTIERVETVVLTVSPSAGYNMGASSSGTVYILDDDFLLSYLTGLLPGA